MRSDRDVIKGMNQVPLMLSFIMLAAMINLAMGSAPAKWALMAPVFVPMFMLLGWPVGPGVPTALPIAVGTG